MLNARTYMINVSREYGLLSFINTNDTIYFATTHMLSSMNVKIYFAVTVRLNNYDTAISG